MLRRNASIQPTPQNDFGIKSSISRGLWIIAVFFVGTGIWMSTAPLNGAIVAQGTVKVENNRKSVQHQEGGIVKKILARDGDFVKAGQALIVLEDLRVDASVEIFRDQLDAELIREARLQAETLLGSRITYPAEIQKRSALPRVKDFMARENALFNSRKNSLSTQIALLKEQIQQIEQEVKGLQQQIDAEKESLAYSNEELGVNQPLYEKQFIAKARMLQLKRTVSDYQVKLGEHVSDIAKAKQLKYDLEMRVMNLRNEYTKNAADELKVSSTKIATLREQLRPSEDAVTRKTVISPVSGKIVGLRVFTEGAAIGPREPLMDIVPQDASLLVEARVNLDGISHLHIGQETHIRFTTFTQRTTPLVAGKVTYISADSINDKERSDTPPYYLVRIIPSQKSLQDNELTLQSGMATEVYIQTKERTVMDYILAPITDSLRHALREI
jgi:HlyD family type I secretion membrane fusion protein